MVTILCCNYYYAYISIILQRISYTKRTLPGLLALWCPHTNKYKFQNSILEIFDTPVFINYRLASRLPLTGIERVRYIVDQHTCVAVAIEWHWTCSIHCRPTPKSWNLWTSITTLSTPTFQLFNATNIFKIRIPGIISGFQMFPNKNQSLKHMCYLFR